MSDARKHNTLFFEHNPADPEEVVLTVQVEDLEASEGNVYLIIDMGTPVQMK